jgi:nucleoside phosphorylase
MTDRLLERIAAPAPMEARNALQPIPWPSGTAPKGTVPDVAADAPLPTVDAVHFVYTTAEAEALADVFTPGIHYTEWNRYTHNWASYVGQLTGRSPAREEKCLFYWAISDLGDTRVLVLKNSFHLATDGPSIPLRQCWRQVITEARPSLVVDSGTAGGVGAEVQVGDAIVANALRFDCQKTFRTQSFAESRYLCTDTTTASAMSSAVDLMAANAHLLAPQTTRALRIWQGDVLTTDFFAEDTSDDKYGLRAYDPVARAVEMDAAVLGLVAGDLGAAMPRYVSVRSASDPQMPAGASESAASDIYLKYGYAAQVAAECVAHQLIVGA